MPLMTRAAPIRPASIRMSRAAWLIARFGAPTWLALLAAASGAALAQQLPVPSAGLPGYVTGAREVPDPGLVYKVVFAVSSAAPADKVDPSLARVARYLNTLAEYGVPPLRRQLAIVLDGAATQLALKDAAYAARNHGHPNPDAALLAALKQAGVEVRVGAQTLLEQHIAPRDLLPAVQVDLWSLSTLANLQLHGYVAIGE